MNQAAWKTTRALCLSDAAVADYSMSLTPARGVVDGTNRQQLHGKDGSMLTQFSADAVDPPVVNLTHCYITPKRRRCCSDVRGVTSGGDGS